MTLEQYMDNINNRYELGYATEHTFRGDLQQLLESLNLNTTIVKQFADKLGIAYAPLNLPEGETWAASSSPPLEGSGEAHPRYQTANFKSYRFTKEFKADLKNNPTQAEKIMWEKLRNKRTGYKIRRQHIIDDFIVDFVCLSRKLVIEIDGLIHLQQKEYDEERTKRLEANGFEVIRFTNEEVFSNSDIVVSKIIEKLNGREAPLNLPKGETFTYCKRVESQPKNFVESSSPPLEGSGEVFTPIDLLDYIFAVLHSPTYREKYIEFLKIDFPRVPYPKDKHTFWKLVRLGGEIRQILLLESPIVEQHITSFPIDGSNIVGKISFEENYDLIYGDLIVQADPVYPFGRVYINETQYFQAVPKHVWEFYIGGYQPAQKWFKDRKERKLEIDDIIHYQKIITALTETDRLMNVINNVDIE